MKYSERKTSQCKNSYFYRTPPVTASGSVSWMVFCRKGFFSNFAKFTRKHKKEKKETLAQVFSCEFCKIYRNSFFLQNSSGGCFFACHPIPLHPLATSNREPSPPISNRKHCRNEYSKLTFNISITLIPVMVTFYKKISAGWLLLKKFIFICESLSNAMNLLSLFLANLKIKFCARIFLVPLTKYFSFSVIRWLI